MAKSRFHNLLREKIMETISTHSEAICSGQPQDYPSYRDNVGYIRGLNDALRACEDIERDLDQ